jgi:uncharacterized membrane protein YhfC
VYRYCLSRHERRFNAAVSLGGGHGGCEALLVGVSLLAAFIILSIDRHKDPDKMSPEMRKAIYDYWALPWSKVLMAPIERVTAMTYHMSASVLVLQVFRKNSFAWLGAAIGFHTLIDTLAVVAMVEEWDAIVLEVVLFLFCVPLALWILVALSENVYSIDDDEHEDALLLPPNGVESGEVVFESPEVADAEQDEIETGPETN